MKKGYEAVTIDLLLAHLSLSKGGFYHHFKSVDSLLTALIDEDLKELITRLETIPGKPVKVALLKLLTNGNIYSAGKFGILPALNNRKSQLRYLECLEVVFYHPFKTILLRIISEGCRSGELPDIDPIAFTEIFEALNRQANRNDILKSWSTKESKSYRTMALDLLAEKLEMKNEIKRLLRKMS